MGASASRPSSPTIGTRPNNDSHDDNDNERNETHDDRPRISSRLSSFGRSARPSLLKRKSSTSQRDVASARRVKRDSRMSVREVQGRSSIDDRLGPTERAGRVSMSGVRPIRAGQVAAHDTELREMRAGEGEERRTIAGTDLVDGSADHGAMKRVEESNSGVEGAMIDRTPLELAMAGTAINDAPPGTVALEADVSSSTRQIPTSTPSLPTSRGPPVLARAKEKEIDHRDALDPSASTSWSGPGSTTRLDEMSSSAVQEPAAHLVSLTGSDAETTTTFPATNSAPHADAIASPASPEITRPISPTPTPPSPQSRPVRPTRARGFSLPEHPSANQRTFTGRLSAMLGFSAPAAPGLLDSAPDTAAQTPAVERGSLIGSQAGDTGVTSVTDGAESTVASASAGLVQEGEDEPRTTRAAAEATGDAAPVPPTDAELGSMESDVEEMARQLEELRRDVDALNARRQELERQPVGAMLIIQGLAQTQVEHGSEGEDGALSSEAGSMVGSGEGGTAIEEGTTVGPVASTPTSATGNSAGRNGGSAPRRPAALRRMSDGSLFRRRREQEAERGASLDQQARMIGGLLTVAAAATANTLLQPPAAPPPPARTGMSGAIDNLLNRLRPNRSPRHGIEQALGSYLRNVARDNRRSELTNEPRRNRPSVARTSSASSVLSGSVGSSTVSSASTTSGSTGAGPEMQPEFQQFLEDLQNDLIGAVRAFAAYPGDDEDDADSVSMSSTRAPASPLATAAPLRPIESDGDGESREGGQAGVTAASEAESASVPASSCTGDSSAPNIHTSRAFSADPSIPTFHRQLGQNLSRTAGSAQNGFGVSAGSGNNNGQGRNLNFFRAHLFPPTNAAEIARVIPEGEVDDTIVPCIFVGVRSMHHEAEGGAEEMMQNAGFPFGDVPSAPPSPGGMRSPTGTMGGGSGPRRARSLLRRSGSVPGTPDVPYPPNTPVPAGEARSYFDGVEEETAPTSSPGLHSSSGATEPATTNSSTNTRPTLGRASSASRPSRSFRDRVLARLNRRPSAERPMNTYLVYVVGGNYPRNHPILRIPALLTGGPLTDEEMTLIGELLGPAKAPTASKEDIERSGLKIVKGEDIKHLGEQGEVHANTVDRCLVCLGDYEEGEECRVLGCRHVYHKECVDRWLEQGANSCPACRNQAVDKAASVSAASSPPTTTSSAPTRPSLTRGSTSIPAPPLHATASGLTPFERPLSVVPESESSSRSSTPPRLNSSAPEPERWGPPASPVPSLTAPIDVGSVPAHAAQSGDDDARGKSVGKGEAEEERMVPAPETGERSGEREGEEKAVMWGLEDNVE